LKTASGGVPIVNLQGTAGIVKDCDGPTDATGAVEILYGEQSLLAAEQEGLKIDAAKTVFIDDLAASGRGGLGVKDNRLVSELRRLLVEVENRENHWPVRDQAIRYDANLQVRAALGGDPGQFGVASGIVGPKR
jgi:hypothetical protein